MPTDYVKCYTTKVSVEESQGHIIGTLHRYGAHGFGFVRRGTIVEVTFHINDDVGAERLVRIPIDTATVAKKLRPKLEAVRSRQTGGKRLDAGAAQSERVAWRILLDWIDAALSAVSIGAQSIEEAFYAHLVIETVDGQSGRLIDYVQTITDAVGSGGKLPNPGRALKQLASGS